MTITVIFTKKIFSCHFFRRHLVDFFEREFQDCQVPVPEFMDPVFAKTSPKRSFLVIENERFGIVFAKTGSSNSGTGFKTYNVVAVDK
jgi:hypothetical protein